MPSYETSCVHSASLVCVVTIHAEPDADQDQETPDWNLEQFAAWMFLLIESIRYGWWGIPVRVPLDPIHEHPLSARADRYAT